MTSIPKLKMVVKSRQTLAMLPPVLTSTAEQTAGNVLSATGALLIDIPLGEF